MKTFRMLLDDIYTSCEANIAESDVVELHIFDHHATFCSFSVTHDIHHSENVTTYCLNCQLNNEALAADCSNQP